MRTRLAAVLSAALLATTLAGCPSGGNNDDCDTNSAPTITQHLAYPDGKGGGGGGGKGGGGKGSGAKTGKGSKQKPAKPAKPPKIDVDHDDCDED